MSVVLTEGDGVGVVVSVNTCSAQICFKKCRGRGAGGGIRRKLTAK